MTQDITLPLWANGKIPNQKKTTLKEIADSTDIIRIKNVQIPSIAVFLPARKSANGQAVIICPGGGYQILAYDWEGTDVAKWLNANGIAAIVLKYRLPDPLSSKIPHLTPLLDAQRAIRMVRFHADQWNIKKDQIGIMGFSAGGHLASTAGTHFDTGDSTSGDTIEKMGSRPDFMILVYPVITFSKPFAHQGSATNLLGDSASMQLVNNYSNELQVSKLTPPTFIVHCGDDQAVPVENSLVFYAALKKNNIPAELHIYPIGGHGFGLAIGNKWLHSWTENCLEWLNQINVSGIK